MRFVIAVTVLLGLCAGCSSEPYDANNEAEAKAQCEGFASTRLKSPSSADFNLNATQSGTSWTVTGTVDSQNSFGASLRSAVTCVIHFSGDTAYLDDLSLN